MCGTRHWWNWNAKGFRSQHLRRNDDDSQLPPPKAASPLPSTAGYPTSSSTDDHGGNKSLPVQPISPLATGPSDGRTVRDSVDTWSNPPGGPLFASVLEEKVIGLLGSSEVEDQENGLKLLRHVTREHTERRVDLCTEKLLSSLIQFVDSPNPNSQSDALATIVNLSLHPSNKTRVLEAGALPPLVAALKSPHPQARSHAVSAVFSLSTVAENKALVGALGTIPTLINLLSDSAQPASARRDAALALHHLTNGCSTNLSRLVKLSGAARSLLKVVSEDSPLMAFWRAQATLQDSDSTAGIAMLLILNMAGGGDGRSALMDAGGVETLVGMLRTLNRREDGADLVTRKRREQCVGVLHRLSRESMRFHGLSVAAGAEEVFRQIVATAEEDGGGGDDDDDDDDRGGGGERWMRSRTREKARRILRLLGGEESKEFRGGDEGSRSGTSSNDIFLKQHSLEHR